MILGIFFFAVLDYIIIDKVINYRESHKKDNKEDNYYNYVRRISNGTTYQTKHKI
jgi:hypothetical protein